MRLPGVVVAAIVLLAVGFVATAIGSVWTILSPPGGGVNFAAGLIYNGGMLVGLAGLGFGVAAAVTARRR